MEALRARLEAIEGIERVLVDERDGEIWVVARPDAGRALEEQARALVGELENGSSPALHMIARAGARERRARFVGVEQFPDVAGQVRIQVTLEWAGRFYSGDEVGYPATALAVRTAAAAALKAVQALAAEDLHLRLIGVKQIRAFDQEITVVSIFRDAAGPQRLVGAVLTSDDVLKTAALAVLDALNRLMTNHLGTN